MEAVQTCKMATQLFMQNMLQISKFQSKREEKNLKLLELQCTTELQAAMQYEEAAAERQLLLSQIAEVKEKNVATIQEKEELARRLAEAEKMLAQTSGHQVMKQQIDREKKTVRDALSYVAKLKRERSIFHTPSNSVSLPFDSVSHVD